MTGKTRRIFVDDDGKPVNTVTAEQHALDNTGHIVTATVDPSRRSVLVLECTHENCDWWDEQGYKRRKA